MATSHCPHCKEPLPESAKMCPRCGQWAVPASEIENVPTRTSRWQKIVIVVSVIILIAIGLYRASRYMRIREGLIRA